MEPSTSLPGRHNKWFTCWTPARLSVPLSALRQFQNSRITLASVLAAHAASPAWPGRPAAMIMQSDAIASNYAHPSHRSSDPRSKNKRKLQCPEPKSQDKKKRKLGKSNDSVILHVPCFIPGCLYSHRQSLLSLVATLAEQQVGFCVLVLAPLAEIIVLFQKEHWRQPCVQFSVSEVWI